MLQFLAELDLTLCTVPGTPTYYSDSSHTHSTLDLVFASEALAQDVIKCGIGSSHGLDHRSVLVEISIPVEGTTPEPKLNWRATDWEEYNEIVEASLRDNNIDQMLDSMESTEDINKVVQTLNNAYLQANESVPVKKPSPHAKRWWNAELTAMHWRFRNIQNRASSPRSTLEDCAAVLPARREY